MAASEVTLGSDCLGLFSRDLLSKPSWLSNITKIPKIQYHQFGACALFKFNPYIFFWT